MEVVENGVVFEFCSVFFSHRVRKKKQEEAILCRSGLSMY